MITLFSKARLAWSIWYVIIIIVEQHDGFNSLTDDLKPSQDEVLRRMGRNLLIFQQIEHWLKFLLAQHTVGGTAETLSANLEKKTECVSKKMLGQLVDMYGSEVLEDAGAEVTEVERPTGWYAFTFRISADTEIVESLRRDLKQMKDERNELVHHFLPRWQPNSSALMAKSLAYLDAQRERVLPIHEHLRSTVNHIQESRQQLLDFVNSPEYEKQPELMWLQISPLVSLLRDVAIQYHRQDGWTYLAQAGDLAAKELPEEVKALKARYGFKTLKKLLIGCETFDVLDEPLSAGCFRTLYRVKEVLKT